MTDENNNFNGTTKPAITVMATLLVAAVGNGIITWSDVRHLSIAVSRIESDFRAVDLTIATIAAQTNANSIHRDEHEKQADRWINQIIENEQSIREIQQDASARKDPFTGTEGAALRRRIDSLEERETRKQ